MPLALITGANRGLGLEFTRQYARDGWRVIERAGSRVSGHFFDYTGKELPW
jgi:NAD(P)-dependent dehydrogenase (short-subunit alcohol dehydrogenase family)